MMSLQAGRGLNLSKSSFQVTEGKVIFEGKYRIIYDTFIQSLRNKAHSEELKEDDKAILAFMLDQNQVMFKNIESKDIKSLSEENFLQFLLSVFEKIRRKDLANKENLKNDEVVKVVNECISDIRNTEARGFLVKLAGQPFRIKVDHENFFASFKHGLPFFGKGKKEDDKLPLSDEEVVTTFLRKLLLPIILFAFSVLIFGSSPIMSTINGIFLVLTVSGTIERLFFNDRKGTLYNPHSPNKKKWSNEISSGISKVLETKVEESKQPTRVREDGESFSVPEQVKANQNQLFQEKENKRRKATESQHGL
ncbi:hypothetical protein [Wolbachia endosymbiont of Dirofilaria (Dirofilaria) immitis]|uniref:hypothetical protein n=1 Tax=Wolbachia endosymbiont of Dirofilaria (Dirofilaria) immitis TaxID=1812115 RepID=UPI00158DB3B8|nr:hypothetical protein [Wolbachia endosymbiont of Dirofilaria (Dirofilaria) immitis]QKX02247.1 hypothetical protein GOY12_01540 [Wolbachia endosymbiont of Dirofilaria (Dirofilaria) immitis]